MEQVRNMELELKESQLRQDTSRFMELELQRLRSINEQLSKKNREIIQENKRMSENKSRSDQIVS